MFKKRKNISSYYEDNGYYNQSSFNQRRKNEESLFSTKKKKPRSKFGNFCFGLMKQSQITGFPTIAESKSSVRRTVKALVFLVCTAGFIYQTWSFLDMYLKFPTMLDVSVQYPDILEAPAVTFCNKNRVWRQPFCKAFPDDCLITYESWDEFCEENPLYCPPDKPENPVLAHIPPYFLFILNRSNEFLNTFGPQRSSDLIFDCNIQGIGESRNCSSATLVQAPMLGFPYKCFSLFSLLGAPDDEPTNLTLSEEYVIFLDLQPQEYMNPKDTVQAYGYIHDPRIVTNPIVDGVTLRAGNKYKLSITMQKSESLPPPYKTNCTDYLATWRKNGGYGPITKRGCMEWCKIQAMIKENGCVPQVINYPHNFTICDEYAIVTSDEINELCSASCNDACESSYYAITKEVVGEFETIFADEETEAYSRNQYLEVRISFSRMNIQRFKHEPKFEDVELFSYIGGYMGMWLGISLISLFDFVEMLVELLAYPVIKYKKRRRRITQVERMQRNIAYNMNDI